MSRRKTIADLPSGETYVSKRELAKQLDALSQQHGLGRLNPEYAKAFAKYGKSKEFKSQYGGGPIKHFGAAFDFVGKHGLDRLFKDMHKKPILRTQVMTPEDWARSNGNIRGTPIVPGGIHGMGKSQKGAGILDFFKKIFKFVKDNKLISNIAANIDHPIAEKVASVADIVGMGNQDGAGIFDFLKPAFNFIKPVIGAIKPILEFAKDNKLASTIGSLIPHPGAQAFAATAGQAGFGRLKGQKPTVPPYSLLDGSGDVRHRGSSYDRPSNPAFPLLPSSIALPNNPSAAMSGSGRMKIFI